MNPLADANGDGRRDALNRPVVVGSASTISTDQFDLSTVATNQSETFGYDLSTGILGSRRLSIGSVANSFDGTLTQTTHVQQLRYTLGRLTEARDEEVTLSAFGRPPITHRGPVSFSMSFFGVITERKDTITYRINVKDRPLPERQVSSLTTLGSETAPGPLLVPGGATKLMKVIAASVSNSAAVGSASHLARLEGAGLPGGPYPFATGADGGNVATGKQDSTEPVVIPLNVEVSEGDEIILVGEMAGADTGQVSTGLTLVFT
jgi:hypothetical protein